jgi:hypothetical protein
MPEAPGAFHLQCAGAAGKSGRCVISAFIATTFAQETPQAASTQWCNPDPLAPHHIN